MRSKAGIILIAAAVAAVGAAWFVADRRDEATQATFATRPLFPGLAAKVNEAAALEVETAKGRFRLERGADGWTMPEKGGYRAKADLVRKTILGLAEMETVEPRTDKPDLYDRIQVGEPAQWKPDEAAKADPGPIKLRLVDAKGAELAQAIVGKVRTREIGGKPAELHVRLPAEARAWLAKARLDLPADPVQWLDKEMVKIERARAAAATVRHPDGELLKLIRDGGKSEGGAKDDFRPESIPAGKKVASQYDVNAVPGALAFIAFEDVAKAETKDFSKATITEIATLDGVRATVRSIPAPDKKAWVVIALAFDPALIKDSSGAEGLLKREDAEKQVQEAGARLNGWAYLVSEYAARDLTRRLADLIEDEKKDDKKG